MKSEVADNNFTLHTHKGSGDKNMWDIIIVGAGCAGLTAAIYAARAGKTVLVFESGNIGGQISFSPRVENYPGIMKISGSEFANKLFEQVIGLGVNVEIETVTGIKPGANRPIVVTENGEYECRSVIIATGLTHKKLGIAREDEFLGRGLSYCCICDGPFFKDGTVAVVGGGNSALQGAEMLSAYCAKVYLIHRRKDFRAEDEQVKALRGRGNIEFVLDATVSSLEGGGALEAVVVKDAVGGEERRIAADGLFIAVGKAPENAAFAGVVRLDADGYIDALEDCRTSVKGIFAAGDCRRKLVRQLTTAAADGAVAGLAAAQRANDRAN